MSVLISVPVIQERGHQIRARCWRRLCTPGPGWVILLVSVIGVFVVTRYLSSVAPVDFLVYRYAASGALRGSNVYVGNIVGPSLPRGGLPFTYTPFAAVALLPTTILSWRQAFLLWSLAKVGILGYVFLQVLPATLRYRKTLLTVAMAAALLTSIMNREIEYGQINVVLMGLCLADLRRSSETPLARVLPRGVLVGIAAAIKLTPGLFILFFLVSRQRSLALWSMCAFVVATAIGGLANPPLSASFFGSVMWSLPSRVDLGQGLGTYGNNSIQGALAALGGWPRSLALPLTLIIAMLILSVACRLQTAGKHLDAWIVIGIAAPALSPVSWIHHWVFLLPALLALGVRYRSPLARALLAGALVSLVIGPGPAEVLIHTGPDWLRPLAIMQRECLLLVAAAVIVTLARGARPPAGSSADSESERSIPDSPPVADGRPAALSEAGG